MPPDFSGQLLTDLFRAYYDARRHKRHTVNALKFELDFESRIFELRRQILDRSYRIAPSICFIVFEPIKREIFAGDFRDRVVHHLLFNYLNTFCERLFIHDSYSCRAGKGTLFGIRRVEHFMRSCSQNYTRDCFVLKLDIAGYFMSIEKQILFQQLLNVLDRFSAELSFDRELVSWLLEKVIFHDPTQHCIVKGSRRDWDGLPKNKSLFYSGPERGLPIGNLTSQLFGNIYLNSLDHFIHHRLGFRYYGRYVDDIVICHPSQSRLRQAQAQIDAYLRENLRLSIHPKKIYLQSYSKGVVFLGAVIRPHRTYVRNRTKGRFYARLDWWRREFISGRVTDSAQRHSFVSTLHSYFGLLGHFQTYRLRRAIVAKKMGFYKSLRP